MIRGIGALAVVAAALAHVACEDDPVRVPMPLDDVEWVNVPFSADEVVNVAVLRPEGPPKGAIMVFPWGSGLSELVLSLMDSYWDEAALQAGYVIMGVEVFGPGLETLAGPLVPDLFAYLDVTYPTASDNVILTGASNGGQGVFFAALAVPSRVGGIIAMPGAYVDDPAALTALAGVPTRLMVGELDTPWVELANSTLAALQGAGVPATLEVVPGQDHVLTLPQQDLVDWIEAR